MLRDLGDPGVRSWEGGKQRGSWPHGGEGDQAFPGGGSSGWVCRDAEEFCRVCYCGSLL